MIFTVIMILLFLALVAWILIKMKGAADERQEDEQREAERKEYERTHKIFGSYVRGLQYKNEDGDKVLDVIIQTARKIGREEGSLYKMTKKSDFLEEPGFEVSEFDGISIPCELEPTTYEGKPAVKVWIMEDERRGAGWLPAEDADYISYLLRTYNHAEEMIIEGGKTKTLGDNKVEIEERDVFPKVLINYIKADAKN